MSRACRKIRLHPFLMIECPRHLFPYVRRIVADVTHDGGFPQLNLEPVDFVAALPPAGGPAAGRGAAGAGLRAQPFERHNAPSPSASTKAAWAAASRFGDPRRQGRRPRPRAPARRPSSKPRLRPALGRQAEIRLPPANQFEIDLGEDFAVEQRAVLFARRIVDAEAPAQGVERAPASRETCAARSPACRAPARRAAAAGRPSRARR